MNTLLPKQKAFVNAIFYGGGSILYHVDAYIHIYGMKNSSRRTHIANASRLLNKPHVRAYFNKVRKKWANDMWRNIEEKQQRKHEATINRIFSIKS